MSWQSALLPAAGYDLLLARQPPPRNFIHSLILLLFFIAEHGTGYADVQRRRAERRAKAEKVAKDKAGGMQFSNLVVAASCLRGMLC
jgi:hypothetical protein